MTTNRVPGPPRWHAYRNMKGFLNNRAAFLDGLWKEHGDFHRFQLAFFDVYQIVDPAAVKEVLMNHDRFAKTPAIKFLSVFLGQGLFTVDGGDYHRRQRRLMQPAFHKKRIAGYADQMVELAAKTRDRWEREGEIDIVKEANLLTMNIATKTLFSTDVGETADRVSDAFNEILPVVDNIAKPSGAIQMALPTPLTLQFKRAKKALDDVVYGIIAERRKTEEDHGDLLSMLMLARDEEGDGARMTDEQIRDEAMTLFIAGHETTAVGLAWAWYYLAKHPDVTQRMQNEIDTALGGRLPTFDDVRELPYTRQVLSEVLRIKPPAYLLDRYTTEDWEYNGHRIPKGKYIFIPPYLTHRHPEFWPDPERFDPERFTPEQIEQRPKYAYYPFGGGPRFCIGEQFAWTEMVLILATMFQQNAFELLTNGDVGIAPVVTLRPDQPIRLRVTSRKPVENPQPV